MDFRKINWRQIVVNAAVWAILPIQAFGSGTERYYSPPVAFQFNHDHVQWNQVLGKVVTIEGKIDLDQLKKNAPLLKKYSDAVQSVARTEFYGFSPNEKTAFLVNAHNVLLLKAMLESDDPKNFLGFDKSKKIEIFADTMSVDDFFQKYIKRRISDPKALLALFCLEPSCPGLLREAIHPEKVESQIEEITSIFLRDTKKNSYSPSDKVLILSPILKKYEYEILRKYGGVGSFVTLYMSSDQELRKRARIGSVKIKYRD